jgi:hypothetical protein
MRSERCAIGVFASCVVCDDEEETVKVSTEPPTIPLFLYTSIHAVWFADHWGNAFHLQQTANIAFAKLELALSGRVLPLSPSHIA